jgi:probable phosphoglycerate mutase
VPGWTVWSHPVPGGETPDQVAARLDRVVDRVRAAVGRTLLVGHGHALRALAARWLGLPASDGRLLRLDTATVSVLGHERESPVVLRWNS